MPALEQMGFDKADLGWALSAAVSIAYGISKFVMGTVSDHSNARVFHTFGIDSFGSDYDCYGSYPRGRSVRFLSCLCSASYL